MWPGWHDERTEEYSFLHRCDRAGKMKELKNTASFIDVTGLTKSTGVNARKKKQIVMQLKSMFLVGIQSKLLGYTLTILNKIKTLTLSIITLSRTNNLWSICSSLLYPSITHFTNSSIINQTNNFFFILVSEAR